MVNFNIGFTADTTQAKRAIAELTRELNNIGTTPFNELGFGRLSDELVKGKMAAVELREHLKLATNIDTGKLDVGKLQTNLKRSNTSLQEYAVTLSKLGPIGQQSFQHLTNAILTAEVPAKKLNKLFTDLLVSLKNTISWQISSSVLMGFTGAISSAVTYAKDLNTSLNNIRIVTGQSTEQMAKFAKEANKAAKNLSTTTTAYTDAALIYYQQGLTDDEVVERTNATVKMANVTGENAQNVSSYMTAIWNNFDDGSKSLEYYADVITALGAATASSSEEIAGGLEKFAAIGQTVGLSYEYATAALATVVSETRQSEDVVGTSFKTIFARLQGLQQGEEQEDGVTLNKYSAALKSVGINIIETNGELKAMDDILNELGNKWKTLGEAEKVALAQTVGGVRQYTQLISLMENWDTFQDNLNTAYSSSGSLEEQNKIYEESWVAATNRITAALEEMWNALLNDEAFIKFFDIIADFIDLLDNVIDGLGGFKGILTTIGTIATQIFEKQMVSGLRNLQTFLTPTAQQQKQLRAAQRDIVTIGLNTFGDNSEGSVDSKIAKQKLMLIEQSDRLNDLEKTRLNTLIQIEEQTVEYMRTRDNEIRQLKEEVGLHEDLVQIHIKRASQKQSRMQKLGTELNELTGPTKTKGDKQRFSNEFKNILQTQRLLNQNGKWNTKILSTEDQQALKNFIAYMDEGRHTAKQIAQEFQKLKNIINQAGGEDRYIENIREGLRAAQEQNNALGFTDDYINEIISAHREEISALKTKEELLKYINKLVKEQEDLIKASKQVDPAQNLTTSLQALTSTLGFLNSAFALYDVWVDKSTSITDKLTSSISSLASGGMQAVYAFNSWTKAFENLQNLSKGGGLLGWLGAAGPYLAAALAALYAIVKVIDIIQKKNKENSLEEKAKRFKEETDKITNSYTELNSAIDDLKSKKEVLGDLTKGTKEWNEAVIKLNQQVLSLIEKYPMLAQFLTNEDGYLGISDEGLERFREYQEAIALLGQQSSIGLSSQAAKEHYEEIKIPEYTIVTGQTVNYGTNNGPDLSGQGTSQSLKLNTESINGETLYKLYKQAMEQEAIIDGQFDFSKMERTAEYIEIFGTKTGDSLQNMKDQINNLIPTMASLDTKIQSNIKTYESISKNSALSWLGGKGLVPTEFEDAFAIGMSKTYSENYEKASDDLEGASASDLIKIIADNNENINAEWLQQQYSIGEITLDWLKNTAISSKANQESFNQINKTLNDFTNENFKNLNIGTPEENIIARDILTNIIASGGDLSSVNSFTEKEYDVWKKIFGDEGIETIKTGISEIIGDAEYELMNTLLNDPNYLNIAEENRKEKFNADANLTATNKGLTSGAFKDYRDNIEEQYEGLDGLSDLTEDYNVLANDVAESTISWEKAGKKLGKTLKDNAKNLDDSKEGTLEYSEALTAVAKDLSSWLGITVDEEFVKKHKKLIEKAITGDRESIIELEKFAAQHAINIMPNLSEEQKKDFNTIIDKFYTAVANKDIKVGKIDNTEILKGLREIVTASGMTVEQAESLFNGLDLKTTFTEVSVDDITTLENQGGQFTHPITGETVTLNPEEMATVRQKGKITVFGDVEFKGTKSGKNFTPSSSGGGSKKKDKKKKSDEIERYHEIRNTIEDLNKQLDETNKKKDRAFGKSKLKAYDDEISKLNKLKDAQEQYLDEIDSNLKKDKNAILKYGVKFDENGNISNYDEVMEAQLNKFNKKRTEKAEKEYEEFKKLIAQYEETHDLMLDEQAKLEDLQNQIHDEGLAAAAYKVEYQIELNDDDVEFLDYLIDQLSDNVTSLVEKIALIESKMVESLDNYGIYMDGIKDIFTNLNATRDKDSQLSEEVINRIINGDFTTEDLENWGLVGENSDLTAEDMSKLSEYRDSLMQTAKDLSDYQAAIYETISEGVEKTNAEFDKYSERLEHMFGLWEHFKNIVELTGNKYLGISKEMILALNKDAVQSKVAQVATDAENLSLLREQLKKFQDENGDFLAGEYANTESSVEELKKQYQELQAAVNEAENNLLSSWEDALSAANDLFQMSVETAIAAFEEGISGTYGSLDMLQDAYDKQKDLGDLYLDDYKQIYELSKLTRDINKSIDDTDNIASKNKLREIQQEINDLQEAGVELSQYDLDFLRAKYELRLAEIALEDAQNAKSQVRMTRDNEGNWSYTYTADQDNIDKAQQNYEDKLYAIQNLTSNYITTVEEQILALQNSMVDEMAGVDKTLYASEEEYLARLAEIQDYYTQKMDALSGQINNALGNNKEIYENDWKAYSEATDYKISANERYIDSWNETQLSLLGGYETLEDYQETFMSLLGSIDDENSLIGQLASAYRSWSDVVEQISAATGMSIDELAKKIQTIPEESKAATDEMKAMSEEMATAWEGILQGLQDFTETLAETLQGVLDDVKDSVADLIALMKALYNYEESPDDGSSDPGSEPPPVSAASGGYTGSWGASGKLAILHEKELILNAEDTRNMLKVVGMTRDIAKQIELNAIAAGSGLNNFVPGSVGQFQEVKQNIVINADFPNASNREEIAAAFDNLLNRASQYANRK